ncbi:MAG: amidase domain-containing protein [Acidobacteriota bacterium]|nr:amidase domain-containing protein [Acidobacteriota bacterium]
MRVRGAADPALIKTRLGESAQAMVRESAPKLAAERRMMAMHGQTYTDFQTDLKVVDLQMVGKTAKLTAIENTKLRLFVAEEVHNAPEATEYVRNHVFTFVNRNGQWDMVADELLDEPAATKALPGENFAPVTEPPTEIPSAQPQGSDSGPMLSHSRRLPVLAAQTGYLNRSAIVNYAYAYWYNYNPNYRRFDGNTQGGDCTNFVSQALRAGGWTNVPGWYQYNFVWWYDWLNQSYTWTSANYWFQFTNSRPRGTIARYISDLQPGDILQADWDRDGRIDHSMIVTKKDSYGNIYLTYHSNSTLNKSFYSIYSANPNATYYGWRLYSYPN